jgi:hypothetical protein
VSICYYKTKEEADMMFTWIPGMKIKKKNRIAFNRTGNEKYHFIVVFILMILPALAIILANL